MTEPTKYTVGESHYIISDWDVEKSLEQLVWITKTFGESILNVFMTGDALDVISQLEGAEGEEGKVEEFVSKLFKNLDPKEYAQRAKVIIEGTVCNAREINFNMHFRGKIAELHNVLFQVLKHQYSDFLAGSLGGQKG